MKIHKITGGQPQVQGMFIRDTNVADWSQLILIVELCLVQGNFLNMLQIQQQQSKAYERLGQKTLSCSSEAVE